MEKKKVLYNKRPISEHRKIMEKENHHLANTTWLIPQ